MQSKIRDGLQILKSEGPLGLSKSTALYLIRQSSTGDRYLYNKSKAKISDRMDAEHSLDDILDTVLEVKPGYPPYRISALQLRDEIKALADIVHDIEPRNVLEIGTASGGTLYLWSRYLDSADSIVSVDLPRGEFGGGYSQKKTEIFRGFAPSKDMQFIRANSHDKRTFKRVEDCFDENVDFLFIDADHTYEGVKQDFKRYRQLVSDGGIIALHDIVPHPNNPEEIQRRKKGTTDIQERHLDWDQSSRKCNVDKFWKEVKGEYETKEIISHPKQTHAGIGVVWV